MDCPTLPVVRVTRGRRRRSSLPQIQDVRAFAQYARTSAVRLTWQWFRSERLQPLQNEIHLGKALAIVNAGLDTRKFPLVVSADGYIVDGHHRAWAARMVNRPAFALVVPLKRTAALRFAVAWSGSTYKGITDADRIVRT